MINRPCFALPLGLLPSHCIVALPLGCLLQGGANLCRFVFVRPPSSQTSAWGRELVQCLLFWSLGRVSQRYRCEFGWVWSSLKGHINQRAFFFYVKILRHVMRAIFRVFLNPWFGEPVVCTLDSVVYVIFVVFVISANPALNSLFVAV